jgi:hypothetical protein
MQTVIHFRVAFAFYSPSLGRQNYRLRFVRSLDCSGVEWEIVVN